jgi:hypothetical protein
LQTWYRLTFSITSISYCRYLQRHESTETEFVKTWILLVMIFISVPLSKDRGHIVFGLSVCLFVCLQKL